MSLSQQFAHYIKTHNLFTKKDTLLVAVSGGADSTVLCQLCQQAGYTFAIAHCNFQLRGEESNRDENFVKTLAAKYQVPIFVAHYETEKYAALHKLSIQEAARLLRYNFFETLLIANKYNAILTAHHANDNVETVLMNFLKGTGVKGLRGILPKQKNIVRPLLFATRADIEAYAAENSIAFITDSSNVKNDYTRNYLRNEWLPAVEKIYPEVSKNITNNIARFTDVEYIYNQYIATQKQLLLQTVNGEIHIPALKLAKAKPLQSIIYEIVQAYNFTAAQVPEVEKLLVADSGKYITSSTHRILKNRQWLIITPINSIEKEAHILIEKSDATVPYNEGTIIIEKLNLLNEIDTNPMVACINAAELTYPLLLRKWKQGDYFYPLGMAKKKKLSRFFIDQKLPITQKEKIWVIESNKKIVWVVGLRIDDRYKITTDATNILKLSLTPLSP